MISDISRLRLPRNHPTRKRAIDFIKERVCRHDTSRKSVYCCKDGTWPTKSQVKLLDFIILGARKEDPFAPIVIGPVRISAKHFFTILSNEKNIYNKQVL